MRRFTRPQPQPTDGSIILTGRSQPRGAACDKPPSPPITARIRRGSIESDAEWLRVFACFGIPTQRLAQRFASKETERCHSEGSAAAADGDQDGDDDEDLHRCLAQLVLGSDGFAAHPLRNGQTYVFDELSARELAGAGTQEENAYPSDSSPLFALRGEVALLMDDRMLLHESPDARIPEAPVRIARAYSAIESSQVVQAALTKGFLCRIEPRLASLEEILLVHDEAVYAPFLEGSELLSQLVPLKTDVYCCAASATAARVACGGVVDCALWVWQSQERALGPRSAFAVVRPPGHHCSRSVPSGFCLVNNIAVAVRRIQLETAAAGQRITPRIAILDLDVHHGEGTQALLEDDPSVLIVSLHRYDHGEFYPRGDAGAASHRGPHDNVVNIAFNTTSLDAAVCEAVISDLCFLRSWERLVKPALNRHAPDVVLVSLGFDAALGDPLGRMAVEHGFVMVLQRLLQWSRDSPNCRGVCCALEGGYHPPMVAQQCVRCLECLIGHHDSALPSAGAVPGTWKLVRQKVMAKRSVVEGTVPHPESDGASAMRSDDELWVAHSQWVELELDRVEAEREGGRVF